MHGARRMRERVGAFHASACGPVIDSQCSAGADVFTECVVTLTDTRQVDCIVYSTNGKQAGLSCDWAHVSVAGKEPAR